MAISGSSLMSYLAIDGKKKNSVGSIRIIVYFLTLIKSGSATA